jgi:putative ABC transport system ATP-binding protein
MPNEAVIDVRDLSKVYRTDEIETHALAGVSLQVGKGEYVAIMGPSGCGKTTLMSILGLLDSPTAGSYHLAGQPVAGLTQAACARFRNRNIGFVFQSFNLIGDLDVHDNVELPLVYRGGLSRGDRREKVMRALEEVGMAHRLNHYPAQLSGGQQQRVAIARALAGEPAILLADEPTGNLDSANGEKIMDLLAALSARGATLVMVTHEPRYAARARRIVRLFDGQVVAESDTAAPFVVPAREAQQ